MERVAEMRRRPRGRLGHGLLEDLRGDQVSLGAQVLGEAP
jgi:hypothetical protein